jgi:ATP-binding cassette subfamily B multidrug efflux pump
MARNKFDIDEDLNDSFNVKQIVRLLGYLKPYRRMVFVTVLIMLLSALANLIGPYLIKIALDRSIPAQNIQELVIIAGIFLASLVVSGVCLHLRIKIMPEVGQSVIKKIRLDLFEHLQKLPFSYYDSRPHGKILVRVVNYVNSISDLMSNGLINLITDLFSLIVIVFFMLLISVKLTLVCMAGLPILITAVVLLKNIQRKRFQILSSKQSNMNAYIHESICGIKVTQSFAREEENLRIFQELSESLRSNYMSAVRSLFILWPIIENVSVIGICAVYATGVFLLSGSISVGVLVAFVGYIWRFWQPITNIGNFYNALVTASAYLERIFEAMDEKVDVENVKGAVEMPQIKGQVEFEDVTFSYDEGVKILKNVSFKVDEGETVALVGPTGAGKTTVVNLLSRFYDIDSGKILVDGMDIKLAKLESLRSQMSIMLQDTFIFSGTIMENIRYGRLNATDEEIIEVSKAVRAHDFIMEMSDGYNTKVNERGSRLSVGQRQLISFARALLSDPRILILDEATSSIDTKTEIALQEGLDILLKGRTSFIIAHRLSTIKNATKIFYINQGNIVEAGSHDELMKKRGEYCKLYEAQYELFEAM